MGDVDNGEHNIGLTAVPSAVPVDPNVSVIIALQVVNSGYTDYSKITNALSSNSGCYN
jgi:hypothetical protein